MLQMYRLKKALTIVFIVVLVLVVLFMIYSYMKETAAMDGYEFNPFHTEHDYYFKDLGVEGHTKIYTCGCYNFKMTSPHKYYQKNYSDGTTKRICEYCDYTNRPY